MIRINKKPKILFILVYYPEIGRSLRLKKWATRTFTFYPLGVPMLAALTPRNEFDMEFTNEYWNEEVDFESDADIVAISFLTASAKRAYAIADEFRRRGKMVVMGGVHASYCEEEASQHCDVVFVGEAEETWPRFLQDFLAGRVQKVYRAERPVPPELIPAPDRLIAKRNWKLGNISVVATRGCPFGCDFCAVTGYFGRKPRCRPVDAVIEEIKEALALEKNGTRLIVFKDDNIALNEAYARELFERLIPLKVMWVGQINFKTLDNPELVELMGRSGCILVPAGLESVKPSHVRSFRKSYEEPSRVKEIISNMHKHGIFVWGSYMFGFDDDTPATIGKTMEQAKYLGLDIATFSIRTPFPGTPFYQKMAAGGRLVEKRWEYYDVEHPVFEPEMMSSAELLSGYRRAIIEFFRPRYVLRRLARVTTNFLRHRPLRDFRCVSYILMFNIAVMLGRKLLLERGLRRKAIGVKYS